MLDSVPRMSAYGEHGMDHDIGGFDLAGSGAEPLGADDPRQIGPFPLVGLLGAGGMGRVYLGLASGRFAAVKQVLPALSEDRVFLRHFGHELDNLARLPAGVSVPLLATDRTARPPWFATAYIPGITLADALTLNGGPLPREALWTLLREVASCLRALHALDMVHRDLKPSNIMLSPDGVTVIDFGVARAADQSKLTKTGMVLGTPAYMSPEQAEDARPFTGAADVFALGSLLVYAATGRPPFGDGSGLDQLYRIVHSAPELDAVREVDPDLADLVTDCLAKSPADRPAAAELLERAREQAPPATAPWPAPITERLAERAAFAATAPEAGAPDSAVPQAGEPDAATAALRPAPPAAPAAPGNAKAAVAEPAVSGEGADRVPGRRTKRSRVLFAVLPVVLTTGAISAVSLLPYSSSPSASKDAKDRSPSASSATAPSATGSGTPSARKTSARPAASTSGPAAPTTPGGVRGRGPGHGGTTAATTSGGSGGAGGTSGGTSGPSGSSGGSSGATSGSSGSPGGVGTAGTYRIKDAADGYCLQQDTGSGAPSAYAIRGACSSAVSPYFNWTFSPASNGTFRVINQGSGDCLTAFMANGYANMDPCGSNSGQLWKIGPTSSSGNTLESTRYWQCLAIGYSDAMVAPCDRTDGTQVWKRG